VSTLQNFDSLGFPPDHPGRARSDTYYINQDTLLRTHTSAHQADTFKANLSDGFLISADVYRRDAIDRSHYPIFHQMEGARMWDKTKVPDGDVASAVWKDLETLPTHGVTVVDPSPPLHPERNPLQADHSMEEAEAIGAHLKRSLELMVIDIFTRAKEAGEASSMKTKRKHDNYIDQPLQVRWVEAYFPFTSPSWELEVYYAGDWLEVLGCGVVKQNLLNAAGVPTQLGWAFGIGLERIAMLLFQIPDIRLFWSIDDRFLSQFAGVSTNLSSLKSFVPFSNKPACIKDLAFWLRSTSAAGGNTKANVRDFHENDFLEIIRKIAADTVETVKLVDEFTHPDTGRRSLCYRIYYRSIDRTLTNKDANELHEAIKGALITKLGVEIR
jgi:phenylalanyl-tRNA synthetase alpha chain